MSTRSAVISPMMRMPRPGPREGLPPDDALRQPQLLPHRPDLVLEEQTQRLDELEAHLLGQAADVVVALDLGRLPGAALDHVAVERALHEEARVGELARLLLEAADELLTDDLALLLGLGDTDQPVEEALARVDGDERDAEVLGEHLDHVLGLVPAHHALVDEDTGETVADGLVHEDGGDRRVDPAGEPEDRLVGGPDLRADTAYLLLDDRGRGPGGRAVAGLVEEVLEHVHAARRVHDLGVELHGVEAAGAVLHGGDRRPVGLGQRREARPVRRRSRRRGSSSTAPRRRGRRGAARSRPRGAASCRTRAPPSWRRRRRAAGP